MSGGKPISVALLKKANAALNDESAVLHIVSIIQLANPLPPPSEPGAWTANDTFFGEIDPLFDEADELRAITHIARFILVKDATDDPSNAFQRDPKLGYCL